MYRKFTGHNIFSGNALLPKENVLITDSNGVFIDIISLQDAGDDIEHLNGIISPGFINAHCHLELSHLKGVVAEKTGLVDFVFKIMTERHFADNEILAAIETAEKEMLQNGIVAVGDICNTAFTISQKAKQNLRYHNFIEVAGFVPAGAQGRFDAAVGIFNQFNNAAASNPKMQNAKPKTTIAPHAPYSVSPELFQLINAFPNNDLLTIHNQETIAEDDFFKHRTGDFLRLYEKLNIDISFFNASGKSSVQSFLPHFTKGQSLLLVHDVTTTEEDIEFIKRSTVNDQLSTFFCLCPNANLYITGQLPDVKMMMDKQCVVVLGTDSLASNHQLSILEEMKTLQQYFTELPLEAMLQWATIHGAKVLQMEDTLGSFEKGKQPGVVLIEGIENGRLNESSSSKRIL